MRRTPSLRCRLLILFTAVAGLLGLVAAAPAAALVTAPGDNGDVKVHRSTTPEFDQRDDTHVCVFYLDAFNFDGLQQVSWSIAEQPPTGRTQVSAGSITLNANGHGRTDDMSLPAGHYKMTWTFVGEHGRAKSKVFWSTCGASPSPSHSCACSASPSHSTQVAPTPTRSAAPGGRLAETGGRSADWLVVAGAVIAAGGALIRRARSPMRRH